MKTHSHIRPLRALTALVAVGGLVALAGCATSDSPEPTSSDEPSVAFENVVSTGSGSPIALSAEEWDALVAEAKAEGELIIYSGQPASDEVFAAFHEEYPEIDVVTVREPAGDLAIRMDQELQANVAGADLTWTTQYAWVAKQGDAGNLAALQLSPESQADGWGSVTHEDYFLQLVAQPYGIAWHTEFGEPVTDIKDLIAKAGDRPVGIAEPISQNGMHQLNAWVEAYGEGILEELAGLNHQVIRSTVPLSQSLAAGETYFSVLITPDVVGNLQADGAPIDLVIPTSNTTGYAYGPAVLRTAGNPAAAQLFVNWAFSKSGQQVLADGLSPVAFPVLHSSTTGALNWDAIDAVDERDWPETRRNEFRSLFDSYFLN